MESAIYYKNEEHRKILKELLVKYKKIYKKYNNEVDQYYLAAYYILTCDEEIRNRSIKYICSDGIKFSKMKIEEKFSSGYEELIRLAHQLFNEGDTANIMNIIGVLDGESFKIAMQAIILRKNGCNYEDL